MHPSDRPTENIVHSPEVDAHAPVVARHGLWIRSSLDRVWQLHVDVDAWPRWQTDIDEARLAGPFAVGSSFAWRTFGLAIESTIYQIEPGRRTVWGGPSSGITGVHAWTFTAQDGGVRVDTEESWSGAPVEARTADMQAQLDSSLRSWLQHLARAADPAPDGEGQNDV